MLDTREGVGTADERTTDKVMVSIAKVHNFRRTCLPISRKFQRLHDCCMIFNDVKVLQYLGDTVADRQIDSSTGMCQEYPFARAVDKCTYQPKVSI